MLLQFPGDRGQKTVRLKEIELKELFWRAIPRKWQVCLTNKSVKRHLILKNNFVDELDTIQLVELQQKALEKKGPKATSQSTNGTKGSQLSAGGKRKLEHQNNRNSKKFKKLHGTAPDGERKKFCLRHGWNHTHVSDECKVLINESDKLKRQHEAGSKNPALKRVIIAKHFPCPRRTCMR